MATSRPRDAASPQVLSYADVGGVPTLVGVAWTVVLSPGEPPPPSPAGAHWHEHAGTIDEESAMLHQLGAGDVAGRSRLAMLHAWVWLANPEGSFASDNWAVPFVRAGLAPPPSIGARERDAARALSLLAEGVTYWVDAARVRAALDESERRAVERTLDSARTRVAMTARARDDRTLDASDMDALASAWREAWERAAEAVDREKREAITAIAR